MTKFLQIAVLTTVVVVAAWYARAENNTSQIFTNGTTTDWGGGFLYVGNTGTNNSLWIGNGSIVSNVMISEIGYSSSANSNWALVADTGSVLSIKLGFTIGGSGSANRLTVTNGGKVVSNSGELGNSASANSNVVLVADTGSVWICTNNTFFVGNSGPGNQLTISNGGQVVIQNYFLGDYDSASNNTVLVTGSGSLWSTTDGVIGQWGCGNRLIITNGGRVLGSSSVNIGLLANASNNEVLVTGSGSIWSNATIYLGGNYGSNNRLTITNGGQVVGNGGFVGSGTGGSNIALVTDSGSVWSNLGSFFVVGKSGPDNQLIITNGGQVVSLDGYVGFWSGSSNNTVLVTGTGSAWNNLGNLTVGAADAGNQLIITNHAAVANNYGVIGSGSSSSNTTVVVTGIGSSWTNRIKLTVGLLSSSNQLVIANGGQVVNLSGEVGSFSGASNNVVLVTDNGSLWNNTDSLCIGNQGSANRLIIAKGGTVIATNLYFSYASSNNTISLAGGCLIATNAASSGNVRVEKGTLVFDGGTALVDKLLANQGAASVVTLNSGTLNSKSTTIANTQQFNIGDGIGAATFHLLGGVHSFTNGLRVRNSAALTGCGTITGSVTVDSGGTVLTDCGGALTFTSAVTNNATLRAVNGSTLEFYAPVINNSVIDIITGTAIYHSTFINNGVVLDANGDADGDGMSNLQESLAGTDPLNSDSIFRVLSIIPTGIDLCVTWQTVGGKTNSLEATGHIGTGYTNVSPDLIIFGTGDTTTNWLDVGAGTNWPSRFYRIKLITP